MQIMEPAPPPITMDLVQKMKKDLRQVASTMTDHQARYLVDTYYQIQNYRITAANQQRAALDAEDVHPDGEPSSIQDWLYEQMRVLENEIKKALEVYARSRPAGEWAMSITGVGPVLAAGLLAHINIEIANTASKIWSFAGLNPNVTWNKGEKRPWNAKLKVLCWKLGESFVKVSNHDHDVYGKVYKARKALEIERNEKHLFSHQAKAKLEKYRIGKSTDAFKAYSQGKLPDAHIHARAKRYAVKMFLAHFFHVLWETNHGEKPPRLWIIEHGGHVDYVPPPQWVDGLVVPPPKVEKEKKPKGGPKVKRKAS